MRKTELFVGALAILLAMLVLAAMLSGRALALNPLGTLTIDKYVIGGGGSSTEEDDFALDATAGQAVAGVVSDSPYELCAGFWCGVGRYKIYLPVVLKAS